MLATQSAISRTTSRRLPTFVSPGKIGWLAADR